MQYKKEIYISVLSDVSFTKEILPDITGIVGNSYSRTDDLSFIV